MANFTRVNMGGWAFGEIITSAQLNQLDTDHAKAVNGDEGGEYDGNQVWNGTHAFHNEVGFDMPITLAGLARIKWRVNTSLTDADGDITVAADIWILGAALGANRDYTIRHTGTVPVAGNIIAFMRVDGTVGRRVDVKREDGTVLWRCSSAAPAIATGTFVFDGTVWRPFLWSGLDTLEANGNVTIYP